MAFKLKVKVCESCGCNSFKVYDATGLYDSVANTTGWNGPDSLLSNVTSSKLTITLPGGAVVVINATSPLPTISEVPVKITNTMLGLVGKLPSGIYKTVYSVTGADHLGVAYTITATTSNLFECSAKCCLDNMLSTIIVEDYCSTTNAHNRRIDNAYLALTAAKAAMDTGKYKRAQALLDFVTTVCVNQDCDC